MAGDNAPAVHSAREFSAECNGAGHQDRRRRGIALDSGLPGGGQATQSPGRVGADKEGQDIANGAFLAGGFWHRRWAWIW